MQLVNDFFFLNFLESEDHFEKNSKSCRFQIDIIKRIKSVPNFIVTVSTSMEEVSVWDVTK